MLLPDKFYSNDLFDDFFNNKYNYNMKCDVSDDENNYYVEMEIPGYKREDIKIEVDKGYLTITASKDENINNNENKNYIHRERTYNKISRVLNFGDIKDENIKAKFEHGLLTITIPKNKAEETKKYIDIE